MVWLKWSQDSCYDVYSGWHKRSGHRTRLLHILFENQERPQANKKQDHNILLYGSKLFDSRWVLLHKLQTESVILQPELSLVLPRLLLPFGGLHLHLQIPWSYSREQHISSQFSQRLIATKQVAQKKGHRHLLYNSSATYRVYRSNAGILQNWLTKKSVQMVSKVWFLKVLGQEFSFSWLT